MANKAQALKYMRASQRRRLRNKPVRTHARRAVRSANQAIADASANGDWSDAEAAVREAVGALDRAASKGVLHANTAARTKSRLLRRYHHERSPEATPKPRVRPPEPVQLPS